MKKEKIPEGWEKIKLKEVLQEVNERNKGEKVKNVLSVTNSQGFVNQEEYFEGTVHSENISNYKIVRKNQFAYNPSRINVGSIDVLEKYDEGVLSPMYVVFEVDRSRLLPEYFRYYFETYRFLENVKNSTQGSVRNSLNFSALSNFEYLLPDIEEQEKIIKILEHVSVIIEKYEKILENKKQLVRSQFVELFGNIEKNSKNWEEKPLKEVCRVINGRSYSALELLETGKYRVLRVGNFFTNNSWFYSNMELDKDKYCEDGDLLFAWSASFGPRIWHGEKVIYHYHIWKLDDYDKNFNKYFLVELLNHRVEILKKGTHGSTMQHFTKEQMEKQLLIIPPMELQNQFAKFVQLIDKQEFELEKIIENYKKLKKGLMQKLLTGKLRVKI